MNARRSASAVLPRERAGYSGSSAWWPGARSTSGRLPERGTTWSASMRNRPCSLARRRAGPVPLVARSDQCLAQGAERTRPCSAGRSPNPEDSTGGGGAPRHGQPDARSRRWSHRGHSGTGNGRELGPRRASRRFFPGAERHRPRRHDRAGNAQGQGHLSRRAHLGGQPGGGLGLDPTPARAITLVTCYPFYFIGAAPQRFIVRAVLAGEKSTASPPSAERAPCLLCGGRRPFALFWSSHIPSTVA